MLHLGALTHPASTLVSPFKKAPRSQFALDFHIPAGFRVRWLPRQLHSSARVSWDGDQTGRQSAGTALPRRERAIAVVSALVVLASPAGLIMLKPAMTFIQRFFGYTVGKDGTRAPSRYAISK